MSVAALLERAFVAHQSGRLEEAEGLYRAVLDVEAGHPDALHRLGVVLFQRGLAAAGAALVKRALALVPAAAVLFEHLAVMARSLGRVEMTLALARRGLALAPVPGLLALAGQAHAALGQMNEALAAFTALASTGSKSARLDVALCLRRLGRMAEAEALYRRIAEAGDDPAALAALAEMAAEAGAHEVALRSWRQVQALAPADPAFHLGSGNSQIASGRHADGARSFGRALALTMAATTPDLVAAALMGLSGALHRSRNTAAAARALRQLAAVVPADAAVWRNVGLLNPGASEGRATKIVAERALALAPMDPGAWNLHGVALSFLFRDGSAQASLRRAIALEPADSRFLGNLDELLHGPSIDWARRASFLGPADGEAAVVLGMALARVRRLDEARAVLGNVLERNPGHGRAHLTLAWTALAVGDLAEGWRLYAARFHLAGLTPPRTFPWPWWSGGRISGRLLVWAEQGIGEEVLLGTLLPDLLEQSIPAVLECDPRLVSIVTRSFPGIEAIARSDPPDQRLLRSDIAAQVSFSHLAGLFRPSIASFPSRRATLIADSERLARAKTWLDGLGPGLKVGIAWRSMNRSRFARRIHTELREWGPILSTAGVALVNLQYDECSAELAEAAQAFGVRVHRMPGLDLFNDLEGTLALSAALDLAISTGTSAFVFPAAAGVETWLLRPRDDYLSLGQDHYPWFPSTRGFVRAFGEDWRRTMEGAATALRERVIERSGP